jgi:zinc transport system substrate-binding protein
MKKFAIFIFFVLGLVTLSACTDSKKADIVTTMFPQYDFAKQIVKDKMTVSLLVPPGAEIHNYEATSKDMVAIKEAKLFIFTSLEIDQWIQDPLTIGGKNTIVLDLSLSYELADHDHHTHDEEHTHEEHTTSANRLLSKTLGSDDHDHDHDHEIHFWTDPTTAIQLIYAILEKIVEIDPANKDFYESNAHDYIHEIEELHEEMELLFLNELYKHSTLYFAGHNAMSAFGERYHLHIESLFSDFKPDADLTSQELITFTNEVIASQTRYLFIEELVEPKAANKIKTELKNKHNYDLELLELHGYHNVSKSELEDGITYLDLMERNFNNIKIALGINP